MLSTSPFVIIMAVPDYNRPSYNRIAGCGHEDLESAKQDVAYAYEDYFDMCSSRGCVPTFEDFQSFWFEECYMNCDPFTFEYFEDGAWHDGGYILKDIFQETLEKYSAGNDS